MLEAELHPRLSRITVPEYRQAAEDAVRSGALRKLIRPIGPIPGDPTEQDLPTFEPTFDRSAVDHEARIVREEAVARGVDVPEAATQTIAFMRHIMIPVERPELGLAITRIWSIILASEPHSDYEQATSLLTLKHGHGVAHPPSPLTQYIDHAFEEVGRFCSAEFLAIYKSLFYRNAIGTLFEVLVAQHQAQRTSPSVRYIRDNNGFFEFWHISLQFLDERLSFSRNPMFWVNTMEASNAFINLGNDAFSFYKEALDGADFESSYIFRRAMTTKRPYPEVFLETVDEVLKSYHSIQAAASSLPDELRTQVDRSLKSYLYWHFRNSRYQLRDVYPELSYWDDAPAPRAPKMVG
ncbi:hypothetical protein LXT21_21620 [Myxococcus sp. K38C18041901]|uniref:hypothetical protein n=1 Tax=Myxococcus guangdongensis TaxID=2906760 RepID=UPI0020A80DA7|nr:hypothetical protein [Myxococcus guangdongensis]MCP3061385.1 hypothetical protein [Myxococcus guangdongensis]